MVAFFTKKNNVPMHGSLKAFMMGFVTEILNMHFFSNFLITQKYLYISEKMFRIIIDKVILKKITGQWGFQKS